jgi:hypothetical protein
MRRRPQYPRRRLLSRAAANGTKRRTHSRRKMDLLTHNLALVRECAWTSAGSVTPGAWGRHYFFARVRVSDVDAPRAKNDVNDNSVGLDILAASAMGGGAALRGGMVGGVVGKRLCLGQHRRTMVCRPYTLRRLGRGRFWLWWKV